MSHRNSGLSAASSRIVCALLGLLGIANHAMAGDNVGGGWEPTIYSWPLIPVHAVVMPDSRIMTYGTDGTGRQTGYFIYDVWDINAGLNGGHLTLDNVTATDIFCGSQLVLPQGGQVFLAGGDNWTGTGTTNTGNNNSNLFTIGGSSLNRASNMNRARWYSSSTALLNGEVMIQGGSGGTDRPEVRGLDGTFRLLSGADTSALDFMYPRNFIAPDGRVFGYDSNGRMYYINPNGTGSITNVGQFASAYRASDASAAMFRPGRILQFGGNSNGAIVIDVTGAGTPTVTPTQSMSSQRRLVTAALLPDGRVLATGGSSVNNQLTNVNNSAEIWNPTTGTWTRGPDGQLARLYHSISLLLPDARVLVGGGGAPGPLNNTNVEVYNPPYLYDANGARAVQPRITAAPAEISIGETFTADFIDAASISRVTMVKSSSVTHGWNMEQRFVELTFTRDGPRLNIQAPTRAADAPPGFWMLFVLNESGVPSFARIIKVNVAANWNPAIAPTLNSPGAQAGAVGVATSLQLSATDPNGDTLTYGASGLPTGLSIDASTGRISGIPTAGGTFNVVVGVSDGINSAIQSFVWTITTSELVLNPPPAPTPQLAGSAITYTASTSNGINVRYRWQFDDGTTDSSWSSSPSITHTFARAGIYYVTVLAIDDRNEQRTETIVQAVHLPPTANRPTASTNIVVEPRGAGNARLWVVNQDNDSVTAFDAVTRAKLAEVAVGTAPRAIAIAPNGRLWVANKQSATLSLIDPNTLAVVQTVALPRASQPFGIAFAPTGAFAFVALEATGQLLKLDAASGATLGTAAVGSDPRHVSVSSDGASVFVSRFISPLVPGEDTAAVQTGAGGGEVVVVSAGTLAIARTIKLAHSDAPDFENQGRGIPNYLGAAVISPDGTQAWVPSKQDNIARGTLRDGSNLSFQNTVRAISSRIDLATGAEDLGSRIDHDNSSVASAVAFDPLGVYMFVALESSREVAVIDAHGHWEIFRFDVGRAPQGLALSANGRTLYVNNFMDRTVGVFNLAPLLDTGAADVPAIGTITAVATEKLTAQVLNGKKLFYDARDPRLARDRYMSCASCHNDGGQDGRVWDLTGLGEGLRNTISLRGRANAQGFLHWTANFDEVQDFEGQIRTLAGGTGLMTDAAFNTGTRSQPLGTTKAGVSTDLDALAAYVGSLNTFASSPWRASTGALTADATAGRAVFEQAGCASCHGGTKFTTSGTPTLLNVGTIKPSSGTRLGAPLTGLDPPTLRDVWATAPYLHDGSAPTLTAAVRAHSGVTLSDTSVNQLTAYLRQIGGEEVAGCPCSIWDTNQAPPAASLKSNTQTQVELGTKFRASSNGFINAIRFYKNSANTGSHIGSLWTASGTLLGRVTFSGESASGWQQAKLATPVAVTANTWYVVSYSTRATQYVNQAAYFTSGVTNGPLYAARDGESGGNGVYANSTSNAFPSTSAAGASYWVDVAYVTSGTVDATAPTITGRDPASGETNVGTSDSINVTFSEALTASTINTNTFILRTGSGSTVLSTVSYNASTNTATLNPWFSLGTNTTYTVTVRGGTTEPRVKDLAGNAMAATSTWSFTTKKKR